MKLIQKSTHNGNLHSITAVPRRAEFFGCVVWETVAARGFVNGRGPLPKAVGGIAPKARSFQNYTPEKRILNSLSMAMHIGSARMKVQVSATARVAMRPSMPQIRGMMRMAG